jgi:dephospho-CoA kinase
MKIVGVTGMIGSGKSEVAKVFSEEGAEVIDADTVVKTLLNRGEAGFQAVTEAFGKRILDERGNIDKKKLAGIIFSDPEKVKIINSLIHPLVHQRIMRKIEEIESRDNRAVIIIDAPLLIEAGFDKLVDHLILVAPGDPEASVARAAKRIGITIEEAKQRFSFQIPLEEKMKLADTVIINDGTLEALREKAREIYQRMIKKEEEEKV